MEEAKKMVKSVAAKHPGVNVQEVLSKVQSNSEFLDSPLTFGAVFGGASMGALRAAELHNATVVKNCLNELEKLGPNGLRVGERLRVFLANYDMNSIQRLVEQIPVERVLVTQI